MLCEKATPAPFLRTEMCTDIYESYHKPQLALKKRTHFPIHACFLRMLRSYNPPPLPLRMND